MVGGGLGGSVVRVGGLWGTGGSASPKAPPLFPLQTGMSAPRAPTTAGGPRAASTLLGGTSVSPASSAGGPTSPTPAATGKDPLRAPQNPGEAPPYPIRSPLNPGWSLYLPPTGSQDLRRVFGGPGGGPEFGGPPNSPFWATRTCVCPGGVPGCAPRPRWLLHRFLAIPQISDVPTGIFQLQHPPGDPQRLRLRGGPPGTFRLRVPRAGRVLGAR